LQSGISFYLSYQIFGLLLLGMLISMSGLKLKVTISSILSFFLFVFFVIYTAVYAPSVLTARSNNYFLTTMALIVYSVSIFSLTFIHLERPVKVLILFRSLSSSLIWALFALLVISESGVLPFLNRETFVFQNVGLISNWTTAEDLATHLKFNALETVPVDLFYGEASYLALVVMLCIGCLIVSSIVLERYQHQTIQKTHGNFTAKAMHFSPYIGIFILIYITSLSSILFAMVTFYFLLTTRFNWKKNKFATVVGVTFGGLVFAAFSYEYLMYRVTMENSLSLVQRFGFLFQMTWPDFLIGVKEASILPSTGIHNGVIYTIAISGIGGCFYIGYLLRYTHRLGIALGLGLYPILLVLAVFMQNGGIFSPSKVFLMALVILPLAASRDLIESRRRVMNSGVVV
jgi:hypothetical protein